MVVEAHKVLKKKRHRHRHPYDEKPEPKKEKQHLDQKPTVVDIFSYLSKEEEDYSTVIKKIGLAARRKQQVDSINRSKSCSDILANNLPILDRSPLHKRNFSFHDVFVSAELGDNDIEQEKENLLRHESVKKPALTACVKEDHGENKSNRSSESEPIFFSVSAKDEAEEKVEHPRSGETRFTIYKVAENDMSSDNHENG